MISSIFFQVLTSWEVIVAIVAIMIILPLTFYITSHDKDSTLEFIGIRKRKKKAIKKVTKNEKENSGDKDEENEGKGNRGRNRDTHNEDTTQDDDEEAKKKYELLKRLKSKKNQR